MSFDLEVAARTVYGEARGEDDRGKLAVSMVILNRFNAKRWYSGKTIAGTCLRPYQFSCWLSKDPNFSVLCNLADEDGGLSHCRNIFTSALNEDTDDPTDGSTFYHADSIPAPNWAASMKKTTQIGRHIFYKEA